MCTFIYLSNAIDNNVVAVVNDDCGDDDDGLLVLVNMHHTCMYQDYITYVQTSVRHVSQTHSTNEYI